MANDNTLCHRQTSSQHAGQISPKAGGIMKRSPNGHAHANSATLPGLALRQTADSLLNLRDDSPKICKAPPAQPCSDHLAGWSFSVPSLVVSTHLLSGWPKKSSNFIFTTQLVFPKSLKFMNSGSESKGNPRETRHFVGLNKHPDL